MEERKNFHKFFPGQIKTLKLLNFMCHELFEINLKPGINFVYGQNGSGKSAILTALCTVFGANTAFTKRGTNEELIKDGTNYFEICVKVANPNKTHFLGENSDPFFIKLSYKRLGTKTYYFSKTGTNFMKIKVSDLNEFLLSFNIQPANPCVIMNQDCAREFLNSKNNKERYNVFAKATLLRRIDQELTEAHMSVLDIEKELRSVKHELAISRNIVKNNEDSYKKAERYLNRDRFVQEVEIKIILLEVMELEEQQTYYSNEFKKVGDKNRKKIQLLQRNEAKLQILQAEFSELEEKEKEFKKDEKNKKESITILEQKCESTMNKIKQLKEILKRQKANEKENELYTKNEVNKFETFLRQTNSENINLSKLVFDLRLKKKRLQNIKQETSALEKTKLQNLLENQELDDKLKTEENFLKIDSSKYEQMDRYLQALEKYKSDRMRYFGDFSVEINTEIDNNRQMFSQRPVGPVGFYIDVTDSYWIDAVENCIPMQMLCSYIVSTIDDLEALRKIFARFKHSVNRKPTSMPFILISKFTDTLYTLKKPFGILENRKRIFDVIKVDARGKLNEGQTNWVNNMLIDYCGIERCFLCLDFVEASTFFMKLRLKDNATKKQISTIYCANGEKVTDKNGRSIAKFSYINQYKGILGKNQTKNVETMKKNMESYRVSAEKRKAMVSSLKSKTVTLVRKVEDTDIRIERNIKERQQLEKEITDIELEKKSVVFDLEDENIINSYEKKIEDLESKKAEIQKLINKSDFGLQENKNMLRRLHDEIRIIEEQDSNLSPEAREVFKKIKKFQKLIPPLEKLNEKIDKKVTFLKREAVQLREKIDVLLDKISRKQEVLAKKYAQMVKEVKWIDDDKDFEQLIQTDQFLLENKDVNFAGLPLAQKEDDQSILQELEKMKSRLGAEKTTVKELEAEKECIQRMYAEESGPTLEELEEIRKKFFSSREKYEALKNKNELVIKQNIKLKKLVSQRKDDKKAFTSDLSKRTSLLFTELLHKQGHDGTLLFDHENKELQIKINLYAFREKKSDKENKINNFSGGERSFATLAFIIAVGEFIDTPFRAMDEFDVFMDSVNRKVSLDMLLEACRRKKNKQFIFVTPQDISILEAHNDVNVFKMSPPRTFE